jgi:hypothetical protein
MIFATASLTAHTGGDPLTPLPAPKSAGGCNGQLSAVNGTDLFMTKLLVAASYCTGATCSTLTPFHGIEFFSANGPAVGVGHCDVGHDVPLVFGRNVWKQQVRTWAPDRDAIRHTNDSASGLGDPIAPLSVQNMFKKTSSTVQSSWMYMTSAALAPAESVPD